MAKLSTLLASFEKLWPQATAEAWDKPGLMLGNGDAEITQVMLSVDVTAELVAEAISAGAQLLITHHPMLLRPVHELGEHTGKGFLIQRAIRGNLAIFAAHTNADIAPRGVTESLAGAIGMSKLEVLDPQTGHGAIGIVPEQSLLDFARALAKILPTTAQGVRVAGDRDRLVSKVALVPGASDGFLDAALHSGADVFITSDLRHHPAQDFLETSNQISGPALIDIPHWAAEWLWLESAAEQLAKLHPDVTFLVSDLRTDPWEFVVLQ